jgi:hypothetical protein
VLFLLVAVAVPFARWIVLTIAAMLAHFINVPLPRKMTEHEHLVIVDQRNLTVAQVPHRVGFRTHEPKKSTINFFVRDYEAATVQGKVDMIVGQVACWPLLVCRGMERLKDSQYGDASATALVNRGLIVFLTCGSRRSDGQEHGLFFGMSAKSNCVRFDSFAFRCYSMSCNSASGL